MKNFLDGNKSIDNTLFLAATNYLEKIPDTLKERPSRFKIVEEIKGITDKSMMKLIIDNISNRIDPSLFTSKEIKDIIMDLNSVTMDDLKHICLNKATNSYIANPSKKRTIGFVKDKSKETQDTDSGYSTITFSWGLNNRIGSKLLNSESSI